MVQIDSRSCFQNSSADNVWYKIEVNKNSFNKIRLALLDRSHVPVPVDLNTTLKILQNFSVWSCLRKEASFIEQIKQNKRCFFNKVVFNLVKYEAFLWYGRSLMN